MEAPKKAVKLSIGEGCGEKLGDIPRIGFQLNKLKPDVLVPLHSLLFDRRGKVSMIKKNIRLFNGFPFDADSEQFTKKRDKLQKNTKAKLHLMCGVLDLEKKGSNAELVEKIMAFLLSPKSSGKVRTHALHRLMLCGRYLSSKGKMGRSSSSNQKPSSTSSPKKSKAIVMDSSSDDDEEEEEEKAQSEESEAGSGEESGAPSDEQLKETVQKLLKEADLEELTMKKICQKVKPQYLYYTLKTTLMPGA
uniref:DEK-C domain-containing protein n=1 Tax=Neogobius melanostomus TaxID=47308 RepID=A0A8C6TT64_9GOBI